MADGATHAKASVAATTSEEDAAITAAARLDPDNPPWCDDKPLDVDGKLKSIIWIDAEVAARLRADGPDWRAAANRILREALGL